jgi:ankyrin repeat protein
MNLVLEGMGMKSIMVFVLLLMIFVKNGMAITPTDERLLAAIQKLNVQGVTDALINGANPNIHENDKPGLPTPLARLLAAPLINRIALGQDVANAKAYEIAKILFNRGAIISFSEGENLYYPIWLHNLPLIELLVSHGMSVINPINGSTPIQLAIKYDQKAVYELLVKLGAAPLGKNDFLQLTALSAVNKCDSHLLSLAISNGADINRKDEKGLTLLFSVLRNPIVDKACADTAIWLLVNGANPNVYGHVMPGDVTLTPLHMFCILNAFDIYPRSPEHDYAISKRVRILELLLEKGADISAIDSENKTALHYAASMNNLWSANLLIEKGAMIMQKDNHNKTPLDYATSDEMRKLLKQSGRTIRGQATY